MVDSRQVKAQLKELNSELPFWVAPEVRELSQILVEGEVIKHVVSGRYDGGFAILCATDQRLLLVDKKPLFLAVEDIRYDMISEVDYSYRLFGAMIHANSFNKKLTFTSFGKQHLRNLTSYIQQRLSDVRQQYAQQTKPATGSFFTEPQVPQPWEAAQNTLQQTSHTYDTTPVFIRRRISKFNAPPRPTA